MNFLLQDPTPDPEFSDPDPDSNSALLPIKKKKLIIYTLNWPKNINFLP
jgi:hypothetical protein